MHKNRPAMRHSRACDRPATMTQLSLEMCVNYNTTLLKHLCKICKDFITYTDQLSHGSNLHRVATTHPTQRKNLRLRPTSQFTLWRRATRLQTGTDKHVPSCSYHGIANPTFTCPWPNTRDVRFYVFWAVYLT